MSAALNPRFDATWLSRVEDAGLNASAAPQQRWLDGWLVRFCDGKAKRARCINAVADGRLPLAQRLAACAEIYEAAKMPMIVRITPFTRPPELDLVLAELGLLSFDDTRVMVLPALSDVDVTGPAAIVLQSIGLEAFAHRVGGLRGSPLAQRQAHAERLLSSPVPFQAFELREHGEALACGQYAVEGTLAGLYDVYTAPAARDRGLGTRLCRGMLSHARARGATAAYLQVDADNHAARAIYHRLGFADGYGYHYRAREPAAV